MDPNGNLEGISRLSLSDAGSPNLASKTPPPPGFDAAPGSRSGTPPTCKTPSFNNLALALGNDLAESMDRGMDNGVSSNEDQSVPKRTFTPDGYARQSRHAVSRLMGSGERANPGGFDYLNPAGTSHMLIPPANSSYLDKLKAEQGQPMGTDLQMMPQQGGNVGAGTNPLDAQTHGRIVTLGHPMQGGSGVGNQSSLAEATMAPAPDQKPMRFTAAMMANAQSSGLVNNGSNDPSPILASANGNQLNQEMLRRQLHQQSSLGGINGGGGDKNFGRANSNPFGVTVVEPPSNSNSPAPQRATTVGLNSDGMLYPLVPQGSVAAGGAAQQANASNAGGLAPPTGAVVASSLASASGGRASAPPPQSQTGSGPFVPGGMTTMVMNNAAIRAYTASSLQMRVAELHQELGGAPGASKAGGPPLPQGMVAAAPGTVMLRAMPANAIPVMMASPTPPPPQGRVTPVLLRPPSHGGPHGPPLNPVVKISRTSTPVSAITNMTTNMSPNPKAASGVLAAPGGGAAITDPEQQKKEDAAVEELSPFLRDATSNSASASSRGLAILYASSLPIPNVRSTCEAFGALESFRSDFGDSRGVFFATYYDLRSAQLASGELPKILNKLGPASGGRIEVKYCVPSTSSSGTDDSALMLSRLPGAVDEQDLKHVLSSFGEVRAIHYQANASEVDEGGNELASYLVEFYDVQDARQALLELEQTHPWGEAASVKAGARSPTKRKQGKDLIMLLGRWRRGATPTGGDKAPPNGGQNPPGESVGNTVSPTPSPSPPNPVVVPPQQQQPLQHQETSSSHTAPTSHVQQHHHPHHMQQQMDLNSASHSSQSSYYQQYPNQPPQPGMQQYQLVMGPDGQYSYVMMNPPQMAGHPYGQMNQMGQMVLDPRLQQMYAVDQQYQHHPQQYQIHAMPGYGMPDPNQPPTQFVRMPSGDVNSSSLSSGSHPAKASRTHSYGRSSGSIGSGSSGNGSGGHQDDPNNLSLNIENVRTGRDRRSSLMVRNIPNKYTQKMLLDEFATAGHGPTKMDFFYLPIDFKNKCNRGYAFVNFVDYKDICTFFDEYNGTSWKRFNSDKICDITYARIQGKAAMLKRFENSALMEKDDEYRPKVFVSHGERKGEVEVMPGYGVGRAGGTFQ
ncbi:hypothetical protein ACHAXT_010563 [Thalassiosira profunda]